MTTPTQPSERNWTGVQSYDNSDLARLPEYRQAVAALDALTKAMRRAGIERTQADWLTIAHDLAASLAYADNCQRCADLEAVPPAAVDVGHPPPSGDYGGGLRAYYICPQCGLTWKTGWSVNLPVFDIS